MVILLLAAAFWSLLSFGAQITKPVQSTATSAKILPLPVPTNEKLFPRPPTYFELTRSAEGLLLAFHATSPNLDIDLSVAPIVQIYAEAPVKVTPSALSASNWPKNSKSVALKVSGKLPKQKRYVHGYAIYQVCDRTKKTDACRKTKSKFDLDL